MQISQELLDYINSSYIAGKTKEQIQQELANTGYQSDFIQAAFTEYERQTNPPNVSAQNTNKLPGVPQLFQQALHVYSQNFFRIIGGLIGISLVAIGSYIVIYSIFGIILFLLSLLGLFAFSFEEILLLFNQKPVLFSAVCGTALIVFLLLLAFVSAWTQLAVIYMIGGINQRRGARLSLKLARPRTIKFYWTHLIFNSTLILGMFFLPFLVIFFTWFSLFYFTFTEENLSGAQALLRSKQYVKQRFWGVLGRLAVIFIFGLALYLGIEILEPTSNQGIAGTIITLFVILILAALIPIYLIYEYILYSYLRATATDNTAPSKRSQIMLSSTPFIFITVILLLLSLIWYTTSQIPPLLTELSKRSDSSSSQYDLNTPDGRDIKREADMVEVKGAVLYHNVFNGQYPDTLTDIELPNNKVLPKDPTTGQDYEYTLINGGADFEICANFETKIRECLNSSSLNSE